MSRKLWAGLLGGVVCTSAVVFAMAATELPRVFISIDQNIDQATLHTYHHTDQGTRIMPAAFLQALEMADGSSKVMNPDNLRKWGFLVDNIAADALNPYGWPLGFTVSDPQTSNGIAVAGVTCALCHTGQLEYRGTAIRIEGGQSNVDLPAFQAALYAAIQATAADSARTEAFLQNAIAAGYPADRVRNDFQSTVTTAIGLITAQERLTGVTAGPGRVDAVQGIANAIFAADLEVPSNARNYDAPVSYPYLWDIWRLSWLQYNGFVPPLPDSRNIGEVLGVSGKTNIVDPATGALNPEPERWRTSVQLKNLIWMESTLRNLKAPTWPAEIFGPIDQTKAAEGRQLFTRLCAGCHGIKERPDGMWDVPVVPLNRIGTDPNQAVNWAGRTYDGSKIGLGSAVAAPTLSIAINAIRRQLYADYQIPTSEQEDDVSFEAPCGYKARPLIGVWATPPFLHNGSVRTIFDLLSDTRPASFRFGSREYDPTNLGYEEDNSPGATVLDTSISGNHNTGHWWTDDVSRPGRIGPRLLDDEKYALLEFLKSATYDNYPRTKVVQQRPLPCAKNTNWAKGQAEQ